MLVVKKTSYPISLNPTYNQVFFTPKTKFHRGSKDKTLQTGVYFLTTSSDKKNINDLYIANLIIVYE